MPPGRWDSAQVVCYFWIMVDFLLLGRCTAMGYKDIHKYIREGRIFFGYSEPNRFIVEGGLMDVHCYWFTSMFVEERDPLVLRRRYEEGKYGRFDYYDAINVDNIMDIPLDYDGVMGVPVTFLNKWNRRQFDLVDARDCTDDYRLKYVDTAIVSKGAYVEGRPKYYRVLIRRRKDG